MFANQFSRLFTTKSLTPKCNVFVVKILFRNNGSIIKVRKKEITNFGSNSDQARYS